MLKRTTFGALALLTALGAGTVAMAQESAVIVLRNGDRVRGSLIDLNRSGFEVRVNGNDRSIRVGDVAGISFGGDISDEQFNVARSGTTVVVLRDGSRINGELYDIGGRNPLRITIRNNNGERDLSSNDIARIIMARPNNGNTTPDDPGAGGGPGIAVAANRQWTPTNITVRRGQTVRFESTGQIRISRENGDVAIVDGSMKQRYASRAPLPQNLAGALIGRIGNGQPFAIGSQSSVEMPASGTLYLGINDDNLSDNSGQFNVVVTARNRRQR